MAIWHAPKLHVFGFSYKIFTVYLFLPKQMQFTSGMRHAGEYCILYTNNEISPNFFYTIINLLRKYHQLYNKKKCKLIKKILIFNVTFVKFQL